MLAHLVQWEWEVALLLHQHCIAETIVRVSESFVYRVTVLLVLVEWKLKQLFGKYSSTHIGNFILFGNLIFV
jgi:hypothetical protein